MTPLVNSSLGTGLVKKVSERGLKTPLLITKRGGKIKETLSALFFLKRKSGQNLLYKDFLEIPVFLEITLKLISVFFNQSMIRLTFVDIFSPSLTDQFTSIVDKNKHIFPIMGNF